MVDDGNLLGKLDLHGRRPHDYPRAEPVEDIVKLDAGPEEFIDDGFQELP